jgi:hypothetical protein
MVMRDLDSLENYNYLWDDVWFMREKENEAASESELSSEEDQ